MVFILTNLDILRLGKSPPDQQEAEYCSRCGPLSSGPTSFPYDGPCEDGFHYDKEYDECVPDGTGGPIAQWIPTDLPYFVDQEGAGTVEIDCADGCRLIEAMTNNPAADPNRFYVENVDIGTIYTITFDPEDQGGQVYVAK